MSTFGMYTASGRVEREGRLVCFAGERMTTAEAQRRGLVDGDGQPVPEPQPEPEPEPEPEPDRKAELMAMKRDELAAMAESLGCDVARDANKDTLATAIAAAEKGSEQ